MPFSYMTEQDDLFSEYAAKVHGVKIQKPLKAIGIVHNGRLKGLAFFNNYEHSNIELSCLGRGAFKKEVCKMLAKIAFDDNDCQRITIRIRADNPQTIKIAEKFGWKIEGKLRNYYGSVDAVVMGMLKQECRF